VIPEQDQAYTSISIRQHESLYEEAHDMVTLANSDVEALIEGKLDAEGILSGHVRPLTCEEIEEDMRT